MEQIDQLKTEAEKAINYIGVELTKKIKNIVGKQSKVDLRFNDKVDPFIDRFDDGSEPKVVKLEIEIKL